MDGGGGERAGCIRIRHLSPRRVMARLFSSPSNVKGTKKKKKAMVEGRVRDCDSTRIINDPHDSLDSGKYTPILFTVSLDSSVIEDHIHQDRTALNSCLNFNLFSVFRNAKKGVLVQHWDELLLATSDC